MSPPRARLRRAATAVTIGGQRRHAGDRDGDGEHVRHRHRLHRRRQGCGLHARSRLTSPGAEALARRRSARAASTPSRSPTGAAATRCRPSTSTCPTSPDGTTAEGHVPMIANGDRSTGWTPTAPSRRRDRRPRLRLHHGSGRRHPQRHPVRPDQLPGRRRTGARPSRPSSCRRSTSSTSAPATPVPRGDVTDPAGTGTGAGAIASPTSVRSRRITVDTPGAGYLTTGHEEVRRRPARCTCTPGHARTPARPRRQVHARLRCPSRETYNGVKADEYVIGLVQYRTKFSLRPAGPGTLVRGYVQL